MAKTQQQLQQELFHAAQEVSKQQSLPQNYQSQYQKGIQVITPKKKETFVSGRGRGGGGGGGSSVQPTPTEQALSMSLPTELRNLPPEEVTSKQSLVSGGGATQEFIPQKQSFAEEQLQSQIFPQQSSVQSFLIEGGTPVSTAQEFRQSFMRQSLQRGFESLSSQELRDLSNVEGSGIFGMSVEGGERFFFQPTEHQIDIVGERAKERFEELPLKSRQRLATAGFVRGAKIGLIELGEFPFEVARAGLGGEEIRGFKGGIFPQDIELAEKLPFGIGEKVQELESKPFGIEETIGSLGVAGASVLVGGGGFVKTFKGFRGIGFTKGEALAGTLEEFAPIKIKGRTFTPDLTTETFKGQIMEFSTRDLTFGGSQFESASGSTVKAISFGKEDFFQVTAIKRPFIERRGTNIRPGTEEFIVPSRSFASEKEFASFGSVTGKDLTQFPSTRNIKTALRFDIERSLFGEISRGKIESGTGTREDFVFGAGKPSITTQARKGLIVDPFFAQFRGKGTRFSFDIGLTTQESLGEITSFRGGLGKKTKLTFDKVALDLTSPLKQLPITKDISKPIFLAPRTQQITRTKSLYEGTGQYERTQEIAFDIPKLPQSFQSLDFTPKLKQIGISKLSDLNLQLERTQTKQKTSVSSFSTLAPSNIFREIESFKQITPQREIELQVPKFKSDFGFPKPKDFDFNFDFISPKRPFGFGFPIPDLGYLEFPKRKARGKRKYQRTPTLFALEFGIKGKQYSEEISGLVRRPLLIQERRRRKHK